MQFQTDARCFTHQTVANSLIPYEEKLNNKMLNSLNSLMNDQHYWDQTQDCHYSSTRNYKKLYSENLRASFARTGYHPYNWSSSKRNWSVLWAITNNQIKTKEPSTRIRLHTRHIVIPICKRSLPAPHNAIHIPQQTSRNLFLQNEVQFFPHQAVVTKENVRNN